MTFIEFMLLLTLPRVSNRERSRVSRTSLYTVHLSYASHMVIRDVSLTVSPFVKNLPYAYTQFFRVSCCEEARLIAVYCCSSPWAEFTGIWKTEPPVMVELALLRRCTARPFWNTSRPRWAHMYEWVSERDERSRKEQKEKENVTRHGGEWGGGKIL